MQQCRSVHEVMEMRSVNNSETIYHIVSMQKLIALGFLSLLAEQHLCLMKWQVKNTRKITVLQTLDCILHAVFREEFLLRSKT